MKQKHEFDTLAEAHAHFTTAEKMISGSQMKIFAVSQGLYGYFKNHSNDLQLATYDEIKGGEFNFIKGHPSNIETLIAAMIAYASVYEAQVNAVKPDGTTHTIVQGLTNLKDESVAFANKKTYPYKNVTQEEFDEAKAKQAAQGTTSFTNIRYNGGLVNDPHGKMVNVGYRSFKATAILPETTDFDTTITITLEEQTADSTYFAEHEAKIIIPVRAGEQPKIKPFAGKFTRHFKVKSATIGLANTAFDLEIDGVQ